MKTFQTKPFKQTSHANKILSNYNFSSGLIIETIIMRFFIRNIPCHANKKSSQITTSCLGLINSKPGIFLPGNPPEDHLIRNMKHLHKNDFQTNATFWQKVIYNCYHGNIKYPWQPTMATLINLDNHKHQGGKLHIHTDDISIVITHENQRLP
jgi:hypothetical protein